MDDQRQQPDPNDPSDARAMESARSIAPTSWRDRGLILFVTIGFGLAAYLMQAGIGLRGQSAVGALCFLGLAAACSSNVHQINWRTLACGIGLQVLLALFVIKLEVFGVRPGHSLFQALAEGVQRFLEFTNDGAQFVFGSLADSDKLEGAFGKDGKLIFAFSALPVIVFISAFFSLLHHLGIIQWLVAGMAFAMRHLMKTSGAETLAAVENAFMGQSEAPLIVRPYVKNMTRSEILALMTGGMATLSGGMISIYIGMGADAIAILASGAMSVPGSLYMAKLLVPETGVPETARGAPPSSAKEYVNSLEAIAAGASTGMMLALNIAAMIIAFLAFIAMANYLLAVVRPNLSLQEIFSWMFAPLAFLVGVTDSDIPAVADLLGTKIVTNEFLAYSSLTSEYKDTLSPRAFTLSTYALAGFANFASIGIQLGALGTIAPTRTKDFATLGSRALLGGFLVTLINAAIAGTLL